MSSEGHAQLASCHVLSRVQLKCYNFPIQEQLFLVQKALTNHYISPEDLATVKAYETSDDHDVSAPGTEILNVELLIKFVTNSNPIPQQPDKRITHNGFGECQKYGV